MRLYLDDDSRDRILASLLRNAGHDVVDPGETGTAGDDDPIHLTWAIVDGRVLLSKNHDDFKQLHELVLIAGGHHPGIVVVRQDNDRARDLTARGIAIALRNLEASEQHVADTFQILNHWR